MTLLEQIASGQTSAVSECIIDRYGGLVWSLARRFTKTNADAEDAVQEIFLDLWKSAKNFKPDVASETTFTAMVARRRLIDRQRGKKVDVEEAVELDRITAAQGNVSETVAVAEEADRAKQLLDSLPDDQSRAIKLSIFDGLSHSQIAELTGLSLGTVKSYIRRGLIKLREQIGFDTVLSGKGAVQ